MEPPHTLTASPRCCYGHLVLATKNRGLKYMMPTAVSSVSDDAYLALKEKKSKEATKRRIAA